MIALCMRMDLVCSLDSEFECAILYERVRELVDIVASTTGSCIEFRKLILPASKEWFSIGLPMLIANENGIVRAIEISMLLENGDQMSSSSVVMYSVSEVISKSSGYEGQILRAEAMNL